MNPGELLRNLVEQIERCHPTDDHGHDFQMNQAFINAKVAVRLDERNSRMRSHTSQTSTNPN